MTHQENCEFVYQSYRDLKLKIGLLAAWDGRAQLIGLTGAPHTLIRLRDQILKYVLIAASSRDPLVPSTA